ncbi:hypothetical protein [Halosimplex salinum]|uniref:hypothetical protein n=1 Tax=Halosimplex salinum TaxID=1710538 RepID=UPI001F196D16|nr:hypothetical protein [Halosimplex salinum]
MTEGYAPSDVPLYEDLAARDAAYESAERESTPFFAVERYDEGYAVTYDLLPAGKELAKPARKELNERLTRELERVVGDPDRPVTEVSKTVGESLGSVSLFEREATARSVAALLSRTVLDESNWVDATGPEPATGADFRQN